MNNILKVSISILFIIFISFLVSLGSAKLLAGIFIIYVATIIFSAIEPSI